MVSVVQNRTPAERFWPNVNKTDSCWLWTAYIKPNGYASFYPGGGRHVPKTYVHRWAWETKNGPVPNGLEIDHLCNIRHCVNPEHLEVVTRRENLDRRNARHTHCRRGHLMEGDNVYTWRDQRYCRACRHSRIAELRSVA
jgi:hypothetical protein